MFSGLNNTQKTTEVATITNVLRVLRGLDENEIVRDGDNWEGTNAMTSEIGRAFLNELDQPTAHFRTLQDLKIANYNKKYKVALILRYEELVDDEAGDDVEHVVRESEGEGEASPRGIGGEAEGGHRCCLEEIVH